MEFRLTYRGPLHANGGLAEKHRLRCWFHPQLRVLWSELPLRNLADDRENVLEPPPRAGGGTSILEQVRGVWFAPLVTSRLSLVAGLDILMLRPEPPGAIVLQGGDIDNRLKTLLDALRMPRTPDEVPPTWTPSEDEEPFFCLLQDDTLVTRVTVETDRLLERRERSDVDLIIRARIKGTQATWGNVGIIG